MENIKLNAFEETDENINDEINPYVKGIPVEMELNEEWRKVRYSCSGAGRIEKKFDVWDPSFIVIE